MTGKIVSDTADGKSGGRQARSFVFFLERFYKNHTISKLNFLKFTFGDDRIAQRSQSHGILPEPPWQAVTATFNSSSKGVNTLCWPLEGACTHIASAHRDVYTDT